MPSLVDDYVESQIHPQPNFQSTLFFFFVFNYDNLSNCQPQVVKSMKYCEANKSGCQMGWWWWWVDSVKNAQ